MARLLEKRRLGSATGSATAPSAERGVFRPALLATRCRRVRVTPAPLRWLALPATLTIDGHGRSAAAGPLACRRQWPIEHGRRGSFSSARRRRSGSASACRRNTAGGRRKRLHGQSGLARSSPQLTQPPAGLDARPLAQSFRLGRRGEPLLRGCQGGAAAALRCLLKVADLTAPFYLAGGAAA